MSEPGETAVGMAQVGGGAGLRLQEAAQAGEVPLYRVVEPVLYCVEVRWYRIRP